MIPFDKILFGFVIGVLARPIIDVIYKILKNAWHNYKNEK